MEQTYVPINKEVDMDNYFGKCGNNCSNCPTYKENIRTVDDRQRCSTGWEKYLDIKLSPEKLRACDGCSVPDSQRKTYYLNCKVRKCAIINELNNCSYCLGFPCEELLRVHSLQNISGRSDFMEKTGTEIPKTDFELFIEPYAGIRHLNRIRQGIRKDELIPYKRYSTNSKFTPFPKFAHKSENIKRIYSFLTSIGVENDISFARLQTLKDKRGKLLKIIWAMALLGKFNEENGCLELDGNTFLSQKIQSMYNPLKDYFNDLKQYNIRCDLIPLVQKGWLTPNGGLKKEGWKIRLTFEDSIVPGKFLKQLKEYTKKLVDKYSDKAFNVFKKADLRVLLN